MFGFELTSIAFVALAMIGAIAIVFVIFFDSFESEANQKKRIGNIQGRDKAKAVNAAARIQDAGKRRQTIQNSLKELDEQQRAKHGKKISLKKLIAQAGLQMSSAQFYFYSLISALVCAGLALFSFSSKLSIGGGIASINNMIVFGVVLGAGFIGFFGVPRFVINHLRKRRFNQFINELPNAVEVIVRGVKAGLPLNDCLNIIAKESKEPVKTEFARVMEAQSAGLTIADSVAKLYQNIPLPEANFFGIVIGIQQTAGGNLSEALGNLAGVLRDRKKMKAKIKAMSAEAKASAGIIGSLPFAVTFLVYITTPDYITLLFTETMGNLILLGAGIWMMIGVVVMRSMINFDF